MSELRWRVSAVDGGIETDSGLLLRGDMHREHIEMGGRALNAIVQWEARPDQRFTVARWVRWPSIRKAKDDTYGSFEFTFASAEDSEPMIDGHAYSPAAATLFSINGCLSWEEADSGIIVRRTIFPSTSLPCLLERWELRNTSQRACRIAIPTEPIDLPQARELFKFAAHVVRVEWIGGGERVLGPGDKMTAGIAFSCREEGEPPNFPDVEAEWSARAAYRDNLYSKLILSTPDETINRLFAFSKLRAAENVVETRGGLMHGPGGFNNYLGAIWCNDQTEYVSPFFAFLGDAAGNKAALNACRWFATYQNEEGRPVPSSIIAEGRDYWSDAGDRGDCAMTACGAARWALANGDSAQARELWPFIRWCLEYCESQKTEQGVIASDSDELEERASSGRTNLATSCLTYDALLSAAYLATALGEATGVSERYIELAGQLKLAIEEQFGADVEDYATYRYHEGLETLRAWICFPLAVGIEDRAAGTISALFSPALWTEDGLLTEEGSINRWDRSTLYALRGVFMAGQPDAALTHLQTFAERRLLGDHVPYCVEAYPEGNQSHLSAESGLFCRIFTEGLFGIRPTGFDSFNCTPQLPTAWPAAALLSVRAFGRDWNIQLTACEGSADIEVLVTSASGAEIYRAVKPNGARHMISFNANSAS